MNTFPQTLRWGFIGCGSVTEIKSGPAYSKVAGFDVTAVMCRNLGKAEDYAKRHSISHFYNDANHLIHDPQVDAIYIATPPDSHKAYALQVAAAGKVCCIEKPMAPNYADCLDIVKAFDQQSIPLFVAYYRRSLPRFIQVKQWLENNAIGHIRHVSWHLVRPPYQRDFEDNYIWRTDPTIAFAGYFDDLASHGIDLIIYLLGEIDNANGFCLTQGQLYSAKDAVVGSWLHKNNVTGSGYWNFSCYSNEDSVSIYGSEGKIEFSVFNNQPLILVNGNGRCETVIEHPDNIQLFHVQNMRDHLSGVSQHPSTGSTACHTSWVMDRILGKG